MQLLPARSLQENGRGYLPGDPLRALRPGVRLDVARLLGYLRNFSLLLLDDVALGGKKAGMLFGSLARAAVFY